MTGMFADATLFNANISEWNVSNVKNMQGMFAFAESFNQDIGQWNISNVDNFMWMFSAASSLNQSLCQWGNKIGYDAKTSLMFKASGCPSQNATNLDSTP